jgi:TRAP-type C4-dicarboxylate transport system permease small subunit
MKLEKIISSGIPILCGVLLILIVSFGFLQIVVRECFNFSFNWTDEASQFCMTWLALFGSIWLTKNDQHLNIGIKLHRKLSEKKICLIDGILALFIASIAAVVTYQSAIFSFTAMGIGSLSLSWVKMGYIFIALPISMLATCYYYFKKVFKNLVCIFKKY